MDLDAFECPICLSVFQGSIFQCKNGHVVCDACLVHIQGICPSCREPVGEMRCRALENAIADMVVSCAFSSRGCTQLLKLKEVRDHEAFLCQHAPFVCPLPACPYSAASAPLLHDHIRDAHALDKKSILDHDGSTWWVSHCRSTPFMVLLDPVERRVFMLLNGGGVRSCRSLSVVCLGPRKSLEFKLQVGVTGVPGALSMSATGSVACMRSWAGQYPTDGFLLVPDACYSWDYVAVKVDVDHVHARDSLASFVRRFHDAAKSFDVLVFVLLFVAWQCISMFLR